MWQIESRMQMLASFMLLSMYLSDEGIGTMVRCQQLDVDDDAGDERMLQMHYGYHVTTQLLTC